jgi:hypothetical protein
VLTDGTRVDEASQSIAAGYTESESRDGHHHRVRARLVERLQYLPSTKDAADVGIENAALIKKLESEVRSDLKALNLP